MKKTSLADELKLKSPTQLLGGGEGEQIIDMALDELISFTDHPFKVLEDEAMNDLMESISQFGVATPIIVRPKGLGKFEIIAGHRRTRACELLGLATVPAVIRDLDDDEATLFMVDTNIQREQLLPSEKAFAYKMKLEAIKRQGERKDLTSMPVAQKLSVEKIADDSGTSKDQVRRFIRLTELTTDFLDLTDSKKLPFQTAVELSYLTFEQQENVHHLMENLMVTPSLEQATKLKKYSKEDTLTHALIESILSENQHESVKTTFKMDTSKYFPKDTPKKEMESTIIKLLEQWKLSQ